MLRRRVNSRKLLYLLILLVLLSFILVLIELYFLFKLGINIPFNIFLSFLISGIFLLNIFLINNIFKIIKEQEQKVNLYSKILESLPNGILVHKKLNLIYANKISAKLLDAKSPEEVIGKSVEDFVKLNVNVIGNERIQSALEEKQFEPLTEKKIYKTNGEVIDIEVYSKPIEIGEKVAVLNIFKDITEQKRIQELHRKIEEEERMLKETIEFDKLRKEFFANLSHELRTPVTMIFSLIQMIELDLRKLNLADYKIVKRILMLKQNCYRLLRIVNNLIDITKIDAGYFEVKLENYNIVSIVEDITLSVVDYIENRGIAVEFDTNVEEKVITCDPDKIERIMLNLLSNSVKFTKPGGKISVNVIDKDEFIDIVVKDTGIGIPKDKINIVFERFRQVDKSFTRSHEGSGIGLSLVKSLVEMHNGTITLSSEQGKGTEITISLPAKAFEDRTDVKKYHNRDENYVERIQIEFSDIYSY